MCSKNRWHSRIINSQSKITIEKLCVISHKRTEDIEHESEDIEEHESEDIEEHESEDIEEYMLEEKEVHVYKQ